MNRIQTVAVLTAGAIATAVAVAPSVGSAAGSRTVKVEGLAFTPSKVTVKRGSSVTWRFLDQGVKHNVTAKGFRSSRLKSSGTHKVTFRKKGTFSYVCTVHGTMRGKVVVR